MPVQALATWSGAVAGLMLILVGSLMPAAVVLPVLPPQVLPLPSTWQVPALLLTALICGPRAGVMAAMAYLTIGLVDCSIPVLATWPALFRPPGSAGAWPSNGA